MKRTRQSRATLLESAMEPPIRGTSMCRHRTVLRWGDGRWHPAAIIDEADPAKPGHASRIGEGAADSRHLLVPNIALFRGADNGRASRRGHRR
jgi:hypothetical protein